MDSNFISVCDGVSRIHEVLETFGLAEGEEAVNIPESLKYVFNITRIHAQSMRTPVRDEPAENDECWYNTTGTNPVYTCKCGCGLEVSESTDVVEISDEEDDVDVTLGVMARGAQAVHDAAHGVGQVEAPRSVLGVGHGCVGGQRVGLGVGHGPRDMLENVPVQGVGQDGSQGLRYGQRAVEGTVSGEMQLDFSVPPPTLPQKLQNASADFLTPSMQPAPSAAAGGLGKKRKRTRKHKLVSAAAPKVLNFGQSAPLALPPPVPSSNTQARSRSLTPASGSSSTRPRVQFSPSPSMRNQRGQSGQSGNIQVWMSGLGGRP